MTSKTDGVDTYTYSWSEDNQLVGVELNSSPVVSYEYDSGSRMLQRIEGSTSTNYHWDGWDLVREEKDDGVDVEITNYLVPQGEVLAFQRDGDWFYLHGDGLSSTQLVTDENGAQVGRAVYGAWGETLSFNESVPGSLDVRFVGGLGVRNDAATGLIWMRHRWYDPETQRFMSRDPIRSANRYIYGANSPVDRIDPAGLFPWLAVFAASALVGAVGYAINEWVAGGDAKSIASATAEGAVVGTSVAVGVFSAVALAAETLPYAGYLLLRAGLPRLGIGVSSAGLSAGGTICGSSSLYHGSRDANSVRASGLRPSPGSSRGAFVSRHKDAALNATDPKANPELTKTTWARVNGVMREVPKYDQSKIGLVEYRLPNRVLNKHFQPALNPATGQPMEYQGFPHGPYRSTGWTETEVSGSYQFHLLRAGVAR